ncbi:PBSX family phage terminase large subunit [Parvibacter caecicola]|uniref:PBSX family phage terminase large subunit n=1 Tax=Parvibacter caecicola TaxID=747645 RepID=UPI0027321556|nr:phage terminase large subunit [Parvibacter caecicola]
MLTAAQEKYCQARARGLTQRQAYREAYPKAARWKDSAVDSQACRLEALPKVSARLEELQEAAAKEAAVTRSQVLGRLADLAEDAYGRAREASPINYGAASSAAIRSHEALLKWLPEEHGERAPFTADFALLIGPAFLAPHRLISARAATDIWLPGGRGSMKSSFASLELVNDIERSPDHHALVLMRYKNQLRDSAYAQVVWAIKMLGLEDDYDLPDSTLRIKKKSTGQLIIFRGCDNPKKIKSVKVPFGHIAITWYEEADMFRGLSELRMVNQSVTRGGHEFTRIYTYNPPRSKACWINEHVDGLEARGGAVFRSTYLEAPAEWLGEQFAADAEELKRTDPRAYDHEYMGLAVGLGGDVFDSVVFREVTDEETAAFDNLRCGQDFGWYPDPWAFTISEWQPAQRRLVTWYEDSANKLQPWQQAERIVRALTWADWEGEEPSYHRLKVRSDDAEPQTIAAQREKGVDARAAQKGGMRDASYRFLQTVEWVIDPARCPKLAKEVREMQYERSASGEWLNSIPDGNDHLIDATRYAVMGEARRRRGWRKATEAGT